MTDRIQDMRLENFPVTTAESLVNYSICKHLLTAPEDFRLVLLKGPAHERFFLMWSLLNGWGTDVDWCRITASEYIGEVISSIRQGHVYDPRKFIAPKVLLVDDLQDLEGQASQRELYRLLKRRLEDRSKLTVLFSEVGLENLRLLFRDDLLNMLRLGVKEDTECL